MNKNEMISEIIKLELEITTKVITDRTYKPSMDDEFKEHRERLEYLRSVVFPQKPSKRKRKKNS